MSGNRNWLLRLILPYRYGSLLTGILLLVLLSIIFQTGQSTEGDDNIPALFFSLILAYIIPVFSYITARTRDALNALRPYLTISAGEFQDLHDKLGNSSTKETLLCLLGGALAGLVHLSFVRGSVSATFTMAIESFSDFLSTLGSVIVWVVMTTVITMLIKQAVIFRHLGQDNVKVVLLNTDNLLPFGRVSVNASLAVIGALSLFPLIGFEGGINLVESLPGAFALLVPLIILFVIPVWPVHQLLKSMKAEELGRVNTMLDTLLGSSGDESPDGELLSRLESIIVYRREIEDTPTWPFNLGNVTRMALYMIIPPLTWAGAALVENLVDHLL